MCKPRPALFKWRHFEPAIILCALRWYLRYSLLYRNVEELVTREGNVVVAGGVMTGQYNPGTDILRLAASIKQGTVTASLMLRKLGSYPRQNGLALALRELGRIDHVVTISNGRSHRRTGYRVRPVTRPSRSVATMPTDNYMGGSSLH